MFREITRKKQALPTEKIIEILAYRSFYAV